MIKTYFKIAFRNLLKSKGYSLINIVGLAVGMACAILIFLVVHHETSYDLLQTNANRIYRVDQENIKENEKYPGTYTGMANALRTDMPEAELTVPFLKNDGRTFSGKGNDKRFKESFVFTDNSIFQLLDYQWICGSAQHSLAEPNTVVMTRNYAMKYFGTTDILGKTIRLDNKQDLLVTGVVENYPARTSFPFDLLVSLPTIKSVNADFDLNSWKGWGDNFQIFVLLKNGIDPKKLTKRFSSIVLKYMGKEALAQKRFFLNRLSEIHYSGNLAGRTANVSLLKTLSFIGLLVLLIACFNFINLSTAQAFKRAKEVGIRKAIGSSRKSLVYQFLAEAGLITFLGVLLTVIIIIIALPAVASTLVIPLSTSDLLNWQTALFAAGLAVMTTILAGVYPAFRLSGMAPIWALKSNAVPQERQLFSMRQGLVVAQFTVSLVLISCAFLINRQLAFFQNADLGFNKSAIITVGLPDNKPEKLSALRNKLMESPQIKDVSFSLNSASAETNWMTGIEYRKGSKTAEIKTQMKMGDSHYLDTYGIELIAGEKLKDNDTLNFKVIVNEVFLNRAGISRPQDAVGQRIYFGDGEQYATIVGVTKNFNVNSLHQKIDPTLIQVVPNNFYQVGIKLESENRLPK